jgi:hypothetical protein
MPPIKTTFSCIVVITLMPFLFSCGSTFNSEFRISNESIREIWVQRLIGFETNPPCGILIPNSHAGSCMYHKQTLPSSCKIEWWYYLHEGDYNAEPSRRVITEIHLNKLKKHTGELNFTFTSSGNWVVEMKESI